MSYCDIKITEARPNNVVGILEVRKITWLATYVNEEYGITIEDILSKDFISKDRIKRWQKSLIDDQEKSRVWIALNNEKVVGFCSAQKEKLTNKLGALYVLPDYQNQGIGKKLIHIALEWLGQDKNIFLDVVTYNYRAREFYKSFGFAEAETTPGYDSAQLPSGKTLPEIRMYRVFETKI